MSLLPPGVFHSFTTRFSIRTNVLYNDVGISLPSIGGNIEGKQVLTVKAIWDTGATGSVITRNVAEKLGLIHIDKTNVIGIHGGEEKKVYLIALILPNNVGLSSLRVTECETLVGGFDALIGMDVIGKGDFAVTSEGGQTIMSFRVPQGSSIDFTKPELVSNKVGRNSQCPCGSGKKYKNCHGKEG